MHPNGRVYHACPLRPRPDATLPSPASSVRHPHTLVVRITTHPTADMHTRIPTSPALAVLTLGLASILAAATPLPAPAPAPDVSTIGNGSEGLCGASALLCCHTVEPAASPVASTLLKAVGAAVQDVATPIGITCAPLSAGGVGGAGACSANAVCCANEFGGLLAVGCLPALV
ncbi:hypothetical protein C8Q80DRAFT_1115524 [Daedaleopsis nitida]|nr:hypothetical protein C8Q80DRAFT_1115524 [Daedaleopsis nitida]